MINKSLITGAGGFIGANLARTLLKRGDEVFALIRPGGDTWRLAEIANDIKIIEVDIADKEVLEKAVKEIKPEFVFHLAHYGGNRGQSDSELIHKVIVEGTANLLAVCAQIDSIKSIVNVGSSSEYGAKTEPMRENMSVEPNTEYGQAKVEATKLSKKTAVTVRPFSVYGPWESKVRLIPAVIMACLENRAPQLANPKTVRDFIYIDDVVDALITASENFMPGEVFNLGSGQQTSLKEIVDLIVKLTDADIKLEWNEIAGQSFDTNTWVADTKHSSEKLNWQAKYSLEQGIQETIDWFKEYKELYGR
ncbi:MAG: SDR family NAD(P)-dependent oxidoreductase [Candidatus Komeilibacteria bacterium]|jgi:UDP-glucose 4-epimerase|nr:SDR family NAD(P)-dependent oxidoreductase [Candidatus Komeilibacteria bacterium]MBT4448023.1 SDR family NAD(P)-dependent oxidoreductase [Candidatus Komeilibacteria bacterium]